MFCVHKAWEHEFSRDKCNQAWDSKGLNPFHQCVDWELKDQEERAQQVLDGHRQTAVTQVDGAAEPSS